jgi:ABC-2 type transport system ATP-binding protein
LSLAIETKKLTKSYKRKGGDRLDVVKELDLQVEAGEIFGFLGPNGAGKTTTIKMLLGIIEATAGEAIVLGEEAGDINVHRRLSYLPEKPYYYEHMTGLEIMEFYSSLFGKRDTEKCKRLLERVNLANDMTRTINQYSKGMQQRVGLAQSLLNDPELLFLDEPTGGLDPIAHIEVRDLILEFREEGKTVFISSHELSDVERICDRVAIINKGEIVQQGRLDELLAGSRVELTADDVTPEVVERFKSLEDSIVSHKAGRLIIDMPDTTDTGAVLDAIRTGGGSIISFIPRRARLEDLFLASVSEDNKLKGRKMGRMSIKDLEAEDAVSSEEKE